MSLIDVIKEAVSVCAVVPAEKSKDGHKKVDKRRHNKVMPWRSGRKPVLRKEAYPAEGPVLARSSRLRALVLKARKRSFNPALSKMAIYRWDNYHGMGGTPNPYKQVYNNLVHTGLGMTDAGYAPGTMGASISRGVAGVKRLDQMEKARQAGQQRQEQHARDTSTWGLLKGDVDPRTYADKVLGQYEQQSTGGKILGNLSAGAQLATLSPGLGVAKGMASGVAGGLTSGGGGPGVVQKVMALPMTWQANALDRLEAGTQNYNNFQKLIQTGLHEDAATIYPKLWGEYQRSGAASSPYGWGKTLSAYLGGQPIR